MFEGLFQPMHLLSLRSLTFDLRPQEVARIGEGTRRGGLRGSKSAMSPGVKTVRNGEGEQQHILKREGSMSSFSGKKF
jgi:hypothetical protein